MRLHIIRHGDPDYANDSLTEAGHKEAQALAKRMARIRPDRIFTSPMGRARATARYTEELLEASATILSWTAEIDHLRARLPETDRSVPVWDVHGEIVRRSGVAYSTENWHQQQWFEDPVYLSEAERIARDSDQWFARLGYVRDGGVYRIERGHRQRVAVFCHGGFALTWLAHLLQVPPPVMWAGFFMPPASVTTVLLDERSDQYAVPRCIGFADVSHLYAESLPVQPSGIMANFD